MAGHDKRKGTYRNFGVAGGAAKRPLIVTEAVQHQDICLTEKFEFLKELFERPIIGPPKLNIGFLFEPGKRCFVATRDTV